MIPRRSPSRPWARGGTLLAVALCAMLALTHVRTASAHPLGNFTINRYARLEVYRDAVQIHYVVDMAEIPTFQLLSEVDSGHDGSASQAELDAYAAGERETLASNFELIVDGKQLQPRALQTSIQLLPGQAGLQVIRLAIVYQADLPGHRAGAVGVGFVDNNFSERAGWKEIVVRASPGAQITVDPALTVDRSNALLDYPAETLQSAPNVRKAAFTWMAGSGEPAPGVASTQPAASGRASSGFGALLHHDRSLGIIILSLLAAFGFGALHALGPGHGKTVAAAYLVGSRGTVWHAAVLGLTVTATHTSTVYLIGFVTLSASAFIVPGTLYLYLGVASGAMVVAMGLSLFVGRCWHVWKPARAAGHRHGLLGEVHSHTANDLALEGPAQASRPAENCAVTWRSLVTLGMAGGLLPCPSAIVVMLAAISLGQVLFGMLLIVAFSLGLASVLTVIGVALVLGKRLSGRLGHAGVLGRPVIARAAAAVPILSALGIAIAGFLITYQAWSQPGL